MNTKVTVSPSYKDNDHLIILADSDNISGISTFLNTNELSFLKTAIKKEVCYIVFPSSERLVFIHFLKDNKTESISREDARLAGNEILSQLSHHKVNSLVLINQRKINRTLDYLEGMVLGNYQFLKYFSDQPDKKNSLNTIKVHSESAAKKEVEQLKAVMEGTCVARDLVNEPQSYLTAPQLSKEIQSFGKSNNFTVKVFDKKKISAMKMGGILAVNLGSVIPPRFNILEWKPKNAKNKKPIVLVGKGIVYDTGGMSLKATQDSMDFMKCDMGGAATVVGAFIALSKAKLPLHVIGLIPSTDNRPGQNAFVPGDVITMYDGSTVEVMNTDAEGRLVLADALHYAKRYKPGLVIDFATLTGAASRALGKEGICYMGNAGQEIKNKIEESGHAVYERLVNFPLWREYGDQIKSNIADIKNMGGPSAGMITAGKFLEHFVDFPWLHFDIAGSAFIKQADSYRTKEGTGAGVRLMFDFFKNYSS